MRTNLSTPRMPGHARGTRHPKSSRIGAAVVANLVIINSVPSARMGNQITSPMVDARAGVQAAGEVANASTRPVTEFGQALISHMT